MHLFDRDIPRLSFEPATNCGAGFGYINQSARPAMAAIRDLWEKWFADYQDDAKEHLRHRLRGNEYESAAFELYIHAILRAHGYDVRVHAPQPGAATERLPEFEVALPDGTMLDVEACVTRVEGMPLTAVRFEGEILDAINQISSPVGVRIRFLSRGSTQPAPRKLARSVEAWLNSPEFANEADAARQCGRDQLGRQFETSDWRICVVAELESAASATGNGCILSVTSAMIGFAEAEAVSKAVKRKAEHYGERSRGFVVAVNVQSFSVDPEDVETALIGPILNQFVGDSGKPQAMRRWGGVWFKGDGSATNRRVSGVLVCSNVHLSTAAADSPVLFHHPRATAPCTSFLDRISHAKVVGDKFAYGPGASSRELFGLSSNWPRPNDDLFHPSEVS